MTADYVHCAPVADHHYQACPHAPPLVVAQQVLPTATGLPLALSDRHALVGALSAVTPRTYGGC